MGKAMNFIFGTHIHSNYRNRSPSEVSAKVLTGVLKDSGTFQGTHVQGVSRGHPCGSSAFQVYM